MSKGARSLRFGSVADMPPGMRALFESQAIGVTKGGTVTVPAMLEQGKVVPMHRPPTVPKAVRGSRRSKYNAQPTVVDGIRFDSKAEAHYYEALKLRVSAGEVLYFHRQVRIELPGAVRYVVDFQEFHADGTTHYVDVKGVETAMFKTKKRQVEALYPIQIECVR